MYQKCINKGSPWHGSRWVVRPYVSSATSGSSGSTASIPRRARYGRDSSPRTRRSEQRPPPRPSLRPTATQVATAAPSGMSSRSGRQPECTSPATPASRTSGRPVISKTSPGWTRDRNRLAITDPTRPITGRRPPTNDPTSHLDHIFDRFWRADTARGCLAGSGLRLSIVAQIARQFDGHVQAHNRTNGGAIGFGLTSPTTHDDQTAP